MGEIPIGNTANTLIGELERMRALAKNESASLPVPVNPEDSFSVLLRKQFDGVNSSQQHAAKLAELFEIGDENVSLVDVMIAGQKSRVAFSALVEVRNKMLSAYQEIMNMQV
jgi:flagellar hook-basal body complex protein FliE